MSCSATRHWWRPWIFIFESFNEIHCSASQDSPNDFLWADNDFIRDFPRSDIHEKRAGGEHSTRNFDNSQLFSMLVEVFLFTHLDISFDVWGNRAIFVNFWLSKVNLQLPDKRPRIKSASPWEPFLSLLAFSCLLFKGRAVPLYQRTKTQSWCFPSSSHSHCLKIFLTGSLFLKPRSGSTPKFFCDTFKLVHLPSCQLTRSRLSSRR